MSTFKGPQMLIQTTKLLVLSQPTKKDQKGPRDNLTTKKYIDFARI